MSRKCVTMVREIAVTPIDVAIYVRRSTEEHQAASLDVQLQEARRFAEQKGWRILDENIFVEDGVSRAEFRKRPAMNAMLDAAELGRFARIIVRDETRIGGDMVRTTALMLDVIDRGIEIWFYASGEQLTMADPMARLGWTIRNFSSEMERRKIAERTREHLLTKARLGLNVGGICYGYSNRDVSNGNTRSHVEFEIDEGQARTVRRIYSDFADGTSPRGIAKALNSEGVPAPRAGKRGTGTWSPSCIRQMLRRPRYRGVFRWGDQAKVYKDGTQVRVRADACDVVEAVREDLRIIDEELWNRVQERLAKQTRLNGGSKKRGGHPPKHLLSSMMRCAECGGPIHVLGRRVGHVNNGAYACAWHRDRGVCQMSLRRPKEEVDEVVVAWIKATFLSESIVDAILAEVHTRSESQPDHVGAYVIQWRHLLGKVRKEIDKLGQALLVSDTPPEKLVEMLTAREARAGELEDLIAAAKQPPREKPLDAGQLEREARKRLSALRKTLNRHPAEAHRVMEAVLQEPLRASPVRDQNGRQGFAITGTAITGQPIELSTLPK